MQHAEPPVQHSAEVLPATQVVAVCVLAVEAERARLTDCSNSGALNTFRRMFTFVRTA